MIIMPLLLSFILFLFHLCIYKKIKIKILPHPYYPITPIFSLTKFCLFHNIFFSISLSPFITTSTTYPKKQNVGTTTTCRIIRTPPPTVNLECDHLHRCFHFTLRRTFERKRKVERDREIKASSSDLERHHLPSPTSPTTNHK